MAAIDSRINDMKNNNLEKLTTPCSVFMTFECEEGVNRALNYDAALENDRTLEKYRKWLNEFKIEI